jgi:hypothetical protein
MEQAAAAGAAFASGNLPAAISELEKIRLQRETGEHPHSNA